MSLERRITSLESRASGAASKEIPIEALLLLKTVSRYHARKDGKEPPAYTQAELEQMYREDLAIVLGGGVAGELRYSGGWEENGREMLDEWEEGARRRLERIEDGESLEDVYADE